MEEHQESGLRSLRSRAERALEGGRPPGEVLPTLERLARVAPEDSEHQLFAHRRLAELWFDCHPWKACLSLRHLVRAGAVDDSVFALMGLCQSMLGNYGAAVSAYRRALAFAPHNACYHHNLGHLLDAALNKTEAALRHLRYAHSIRAEEDEITASLAHCLARVGQLDEAKSMARKALGCNPGNRSHRALVNWLEQKK